MSLTSFLKDEEVCNAFRRFFKIPKFNVSAELLAPPFTENYSLVGTAFDYLLRFYVKRLNRDAIESPWASEKALDLLFWHRFYSRATRCLSILVSYEKLKKRSNLQESLRRVPQNGCCKP